MLWAKSDSDIYYNKTSDKAATIWETSDLGYTLGGPLYMLQNWDMYLNFLNPGTSVNIFKLATTVTLYINFQLRQTW